MPPLCPLRVCPAFPAALGPAMLRPGGAARDDGVEPVADDETAAPAGPRGAGDRQLERGRGRSPASLPQSVPVSVGPDLHRRPPRRDISAGTARFALPSPDGDAAVDGGLPDVGVQAFDIGAPPRTRSRVRPCPEGGDRAGPSRGTMYRPLGGSGGAGGTSVVGSLGVGEDDDDSSNRVVRDDDSGFEEDDDGAGELEDASETELESVSSAPSYDAYASRYGSSPATWGTFLHHPRQPGGDGSSRHGGNGSGGGGGSGSGGGGGGSGSGGGGGGGGVGGSSSSSATVQASHRAGMRSHSGGGGEVAGGHHGGRHGHGGSHGRDHHTPGIMPGLPHVMSAPTVQIPLTPSVPQPLSRGHAGNNSLPHLGAADLRSLSSDGLSAKGQSAATSHLTEGEILARIQELHRELTVVRESEEAAAGGGGGVGGAASEAAAGADGRPGGSVLGENGLGGSTPGRRLLVVSNRLPVTISKNHEGQWDFKMSAGGLVSALAGVKNEFPFVWVGWSGSEVPDADQDSLRTELRAQHECVPVFLSDFDAHLYYNGFCNDVLWPLFHYVPLPIVSSDGERKFDVKYWEAYSKANHRFAEAIMQVYEPGDLIWVQDYHLMLLPSLLRKRIRDVTIGFFLHTPFPSSEVYRILPMRNKVLQGVLAADLIGFHTYDYARHFLSVCTRILGLEASPKGVDYKDHFAHVGIFPIGIDPTAFIRALDLPSVQERASELQAKFAGKKVLLGVDRLDYIKGVPHKLMAFETLLARHPEWNERAVLVQIAVPSRTEVEEYKKLSSQTHELVGRINGKFGSVDYSPIVFINQSVNFHDLVALYSVADVCVVSSIRDGMNLVSYEYVMCQRERHGVLVLSEFAGSAQSLSGALRVNPWNIEELATALHDALSASPRERQLKQQKLYRYVTTHTAAFWAQSFVSELRELANLGREARDARGANLPLPFLRVERELVSAMQPRRHRLFLFEYEGTLCAPVALADLATPSSSLRRYLARLSSDRANAVYIFSSRSKTVLDSWFGDLHVGLVAEHGCDFRHPGHPAWEPLIGLHDPAWRDEVVPILQYFSERTPGSHLELKEKVITWHFRDADPQFGSWQAKELQLLLAESCTNLPVEVVSGSKFLELRPVGVNRVAAVQRIIAELPEPALDFVLSLGSDKADEEVFSYLSTYIKNEPEVSTLCCRVGKQQSSSADRYIPDVDSALRVLREIAPAAKRTAGLASSASGLLSFMDLPGSNKSSSTLGHFAAASRASSIIKNAGGVKNALQLAKTGDGSRLRDIAAASLAESKNARVKSGNAGPASSSTSFVPVPGSTPLRVAASQSHMSLPVGTRPGPALSSSSQRPIMPRPAGASSASSLTPELLSRQSSKLGGQSTFDTVPPSTVPASAPLPSPDLAAATTPSALVQQPTPSTMVNESAVQLDISDLPSASPASAAPTPVSTPSDGSTRGHPSTRSSPGPTAAQQRATHKAAGVRFLDMEPDIPEVSCSPP